MSNPVLEVSAAPSETAATHFAARLTFETDCADVAAALQSSDPGFVLLHVVGTREAYEARHVPGAVHLPHAEITGERMAEWAPVPLFVVYCAGPHCNGADRAALKLARLGLPVKLMIGGLTGWADEGFAYATGPEPSSIAEAA